MEKNVQKQRCTANNFCLALYWLRYSPSGTTASQRRKVEEQVAPNLGVDVTLHAVAAATAAVRARRTIMIMIV